jgi:hypothetical protein
MLHRSRTYLLYVTQGAGESCACIDHACNTVPEGTTEGLLIDIGNKLKLKQNRQSRTNHTHR